MSVTTGTPRAVEPIYPIRICYVISALNTPRAGTEGHLLRLLRSLDRKRFQPRLVVLQESDWSHLVTEAGIPLDVLGFRSFWRPGDWLAIRRLAHLMKQDRTQIAELYFTDAHFVGALAARLAGVPSIVSCRRDLGHQYGKKELILTRMANRFVTRFLANSQEVVRRISSLEGLEADGFEVILNGIDLSAFDRQAAEAPIEKFVRATTGKQVVSLAANLRPVKNHAGFLLAARAVCDEIDNVVFVILGTGRLKESLQQQAAELGIADRVLWLGSVPSTAAYLARSHVGCLTSHSEGFSNAILEYMAAALPVVATRVGGAEEAVIEGDTGFLVEPGDMKGFARRLIGLLRDPDRRGRMGAGGRARVEQDFTLRGQMDAYESMYENELSRS